MSYRYIGNKARLLPWLIPQIQSKIKNGDCVADLMCGTATVSQSLREAGYRVIAADMMTYAVFHAQVRLNIAEAPSFRGLAMGTYQDVLCKLQCLAPQDGYCVQEYSPAGKPKDCDTPRMYFTPDNAAKLDAILACLADWEAQGRLTHDERVLLRHDLVLAANRVANIAGTYGHYRSSWTNGALRPLTLTPYPFVSGFRADHCVMQGYAEDLAPLLRADLCYLDPPYMKRQYAANYHILETLARGDQPEAAGVSGLRPWRDQYSNFCSKLKIREAFTAIIEPMDCPQFLISYSEDGLLSLQELQALLERFGTVEVIQYAYPRFRSNQSALEPTVSEYLFHLTRG